jgi:hypothetical protein
MKIFLYDYDMIFITAWQPPGDLTNQLEYIDLWVKGDGAMVVFDHAAKGFLLVESGPRGLWCCEVRQTPPCRNGDNGLPAGEEIDG